MSSVALGDHRTASVQDQASSDFASLRSFLALAEVLCCSRFGTSTSGTLRLPRSSDHCRTVVVP